MSELEPLVVEFGWMKFVRVVERYIEAQHSRIHANIHKANNAGIVHVAFHSVLPDLLAIVKDKDRFVQFCDACAEVQPGIA